MVDDEARNRAIYHALKTADDAAAALHTHLIVEHGATRGGQDVESQRVEAKARPCEDKDAGATAVRHEASQLFAGGRERRLGHRRSVGVLSVVRHVGPPRWALSQAMTPA